MTDVFVIEELSKSSSPTTHQNPSAHVEDRDAITYLYTSGTTSFPKGVVGTHLAMYLESMRGALDVRLDASTTGSSAMMPMFHTAQLNAFCTPAMLVGATIHVQRGFDAGALLEPSSPSGITQIFGLPMMYRAMLDHPAIAPRTCPSCGAPSTRWRRCRTR